MVLVSVLDSVLCVIGMMIHSDETAGTSLIVSCTALSQNYLLIYCLCQCRGEGEAAGTTCQQSR